MADFTSTPNVSKGTSTHIRTLYSDDTSYLTITFYNTNLSFKFVPFMGKDANGKNKYNEGKMITSTINFEGASLLQQAVLDVINNFGPTDTIIVPIECNNNVKIIFERRLDQNNQPSSWLSIDKNGEVIPFRFNTQIVNLKKNGQITTKVIETGLMVLVKIIEGYLTGINASRHLNKLTEDFAKAQENKQADGVQQQGGYQNKYPNNYQKKPYNNYKKYNNNYPNQNNYPQQNQNQNTWGNNTPSQTVGMASYNIPS